MRKATAGGRLVLASPEAPTMATWGKEMRYVNRELGGLSDRMGVM
jgi:hypothetical protein